MLIDYILQHPKQNVNAFALFLSQVYPIVYIWIIIFLA